MAYNVDLSIINLVLLVFLVFAVKKGIKLFKKWRLKRMLAKWENTPKDKVILHTLWRCKVSPSISPFGLKLETYLRMAKIPYELDTKDPIGPKGKLPWITLNGTHIADSHIIIKFLNKKFSVDLNKNSSDEKVAIATACRVMLESHFVWGIAQYRFIENLSAFKQLMRIPTMLNLLMPLRGWSLKKRMDAQGIGLHTRTEIYQMTEDDLRTVSSILGTQKFLGGDQPCEEDCAVFGLTAQAVWGMPGSSFERLVEGELSNLKGYCERMKHLVWPDWEECIDKN